MTPGDIPGTAATLSDRVALVTAQQTHDTRGLSAGESLLRAVIDDGLPEDAV